MENFKVVDTETGKQLGKGFMVKSEAKVQRDKLQAATKKGMPPVDQRHDQTLWAFKVSPGKDHPRLKPVQ